MFFQKSAFLAVLPLLKGSIAFNPIQGPITGEVTKYEHTVSDKPSLTVVQADVVAPSGSTAVIDFVSSTKQTSAKSSTHAPTISTHCPSSSCPVTLVPVKISPGVSTWIQHFETTFSVPTGSVPVIHFSSIQYGAGGTGESSTSSHSSGSSSTTTSSSSGATGKESSTDASGSESTQSTATSTASTSTSQSKTTATSDKVHTSHTGGRTGSGGVSSSTPLTSKTTGTATETNSQPAHSSESTSGTSSVSTSTDETTTRSDGRTGSNTSNHPNTTGGHSSNNVHRTRTMTTSSDDSTTTASSSTSGGTSTTPYGSASVSGTSTQSTSSDSSSTADAPDLEQMVSMVSTLTGTASEEMAAVITNWPTKTATVAWDVLADEMTQTTTGTSSATGGFFIGLWFEDLNANIQKANLKDSETIKHVKDNIAKGEAVIENYIKKRKDSGKGGSGGSHQSGCSSKKGLFSAFTNIINKVSCFVKKAEDSITKGSKTIGPIINDGLDLTKSGLLDLKDKLPDVDDIRSEIESNFKNKFKELTEVAEKLQNLEEQEENDDDNKTTSEDSSTGTSSGTSSETSTATCTSETTVTDCQDKTLFITSTVSSGSTGSPTVITSTTSTCSTKTGCDITATTATTTSYSGVKACTRRSTSASLTDVSGSITGTSSGTSSSSTSTTSYTGITTEYSSDTSSGTSSGTITSGPKTTGTTLMTTTRASTASGPCQGTDVLVPSGTRTYCECLTATTGTATESVTSYLTESSGGKCADYTAFPTTGFMDVSETYSDLCKVNFGGDGGIDGQGTGANSKSGYCACESSGTQQWVPLPHTQGSETALVCAYITSVSFTTNTPTTTETPTTIFVTDFTSSDLGNGNHWAFATGVVTTNTNNYGHLDDFTPIVETVGQGTATKEWVTNYETTDAGTTWWYAEATGDGNGEVTAVGEPTATAVPSATQHCVRYVIPGPDTNAVYNSAKDEYVFAIYGVEGWDNIQNADHLIEKIDKCGVSNIHAEMNTGLWGTTAMWRAANGYYDVLETCLMTEFAKLGAKTDGWGGCKGESWLGQATDYQGNPYKDNAPAEMDWIYKKFPKKIASGYPLATATGS